MSGLAIRTQDRIIVTGAGQQQTPCPNGVDIESLKVRQEGGGAFNCAAHSRKFVGDDISIRSIKVDNTYAAGKIRIELNENHQFRPGDVARITNTVNYNGTLRVLQTIRPRIIVVDDTYIADEQVGNIQLNITAAADKAMYEIFASTAAVGGTATLAGPARFRNQDIEIGTHAHDNFIWLDISAVGNYVIVVEATTEMT